MLPTSRVVRQIIPGIHYLTVEELESTTSLRLFDLHESFHMDAGGSFRGSKSLSTGGIDGSRFTTMEVDGSFHHRWKWKLPRPYSGEASTSFHIPLYTSTYLHEPHKLLVAYRRVHRLPLLPRASTDFYNLPDCRKL